MSQRKNIILSLIIGFLIAAVYWISRGVNSFFNLYDIAVIVIFGMPIDLVLGFFDIPDWLDDPVLPFILYGLFNSIITLMIIKFFHLIFKK